jgi:hypothetical protein
MADRSGRRRAPYPAGGKRKLAPFNPAGTLREIVSHAVLLGMAWFGGLGYLGTLLVLAAETLIIIGLSIFLYPERGLRRHLWDLVKAGAVLAFLFVFVLATFVGAQPNSAGAGLERLGLHWSLIGWALAYTAVHLVAMVVYASRQARPRKAWAGLALTQGGITFVALFCTIFVVTFIGSWLEPLVRTYWPAVQSGDVLVTLAVLVRLGFAVLMSHIPEDELDEIADNPYVD